MADLRKILLIDATLHKKDATGITLSNLFGSWPKDHLYMIGNQEMTELSRMEGFKNVYTLGYKDYYHRFPVGFIINILKLFRNKDSVTKTGGIAKIKSDNMDHKGSTNNLSLRTLIFNIFQSLGLDHLFFRQVISADLKNWIVDTNPCCFYALLSTRHSILFAEKLVSEFRKPIIIHIMDDWPATIGTNTLFPKYWNKKINSEFQQLVDLSQGRIAISETMASEYKIRFGGQWSYFHNPIDIKFWAKSAKKSYKKNECFSILYSGRLSQGLNKILQKIAICIDELNETELLSIQLKLQSNSKPIWVENYSCIIYSNYVEYHLLPDLFSSADILLLPYDFRGPSFEFIRLSMPTKVAEYMASGTPILLIAPESTALSQYAKKYEWGYIINSNEKEEIKKGIMELYFNQALRAENGKKGQEISVSRHGLEIVQNQFELFITSNI